MTFLIYPKFIISLNPLYSCRRFIILIIINYSIIRYRFRRYPVKSSSRNNTTISYIITSNKVNNIFTVYTIWRWKLIISSIIISILIKCNFYLTWWITTRVNISFYRITINTTSRVRYTIQCKAYSIFIYVITSRIRTCCRWSTIRLNVYTIWHRRILINSLITEIICSTIREMNKTSKSSYRDIPIARQWSIHSRI